MSGPLLALTLSVFAAAPDAPVRAWSTQAPARFEGALLAQVSPATPDVFAAPLLYRVEDAPTTPVQAFISSGLTSLTGLVVLAGLSAGPPLGLQGASEAFQLRLATSLFLMSAGPSVGDLLNHDLAGFLIGTVGRSALVALSWGSVLLVSQPQVDSAVVVGAVLFVTLAALVWTGWSTADLVRAFFAPERWVDRQNEQLRRRPPARAQGREGPYAFVF